MQSIPEHFLIDNENDITTYFYCIRDIMPKEVLDIGMFLKRCTAVSRFLNGWEISFNTKLTGVDLYPDLKMDIYTKIYDKIISLEKVSSLNQHFDLTIIMNIIDLIPEGKWRSLYSVAGQCSDYVITEFREKAVENIKDYDSIRCLNYGAKKYLLYCFTEAGKQ